MSNHRPSRSSRRANIGAAAVIVLAIAAAAMPFLLSDDFVSAHLSSGGYGSPEVRLYATQLSQLDARLAELNSKATIQKDKIHKLSIACEQAVISAIEAHVPMNPVPKCEGFRKGDSDNPNLMKAQLLEANTAIDNLREATATGTKLDDDIRNASADRANVQTQYNNASAGAAMAQAGQSQWSLILMRYGSFGAIGAIGFNAILRMGVYVSASSGRRSTGAEIVFYLVGCMLVAAILAVILVPRLVDIVDKSGNYALTPQGVSVALAAGLVGDVALRAVKAIFGRVD